ncbi:flagellar basal body rod protein FlgF [Rhodoferax antarcticus]|uniref:Flagellar basal-body rod protein FlgF n=1 Tax=Rhodoferax antarcticus ANT.BR TaxID=1111071 RepID=A0A1Q8YGR5_9BURK|nr:flagellar basal body rod protein FlgF [Rhodoferax antarcticus]APW45593.1 flagellar biosynthesis protein FlgF [Rhodoferax antarcticus]MCW2312828.1 flagellar basal-body rod protein FlgF [Rhodoferax antarcticus]OLP07080.1 flagellar basal-body rod protein FlgF [Rhodoferax antarcticus ANT.BR]
MDKLIYTAMTGANAAANRQAVLSNNLANVSTNGFRAELSTYRAVPVRGDGSTTRVMALEATPGFSDIPGSPQRTGRAMDAMTTGNSWFAVQGLDGTEAYTRNGSFEVDSEGTIKTNNGYTVFSDGSAPLTAPAGAEVTLGSDGTLSAKVGNQPPTGIGRLKLATPTADDPLKRGDDGLFRTTSTEPMPNDTNARLQLGVIEGSNVNAIETMVGMIQTARQFEAQTRLMQTAEQDDRSAAQLLSMQG